MQMTRNTLRAASLASRLRSSHATFAAACLAAVLVLLPCSPAAQGQAPGATLTKTAGLTGIGSTVGATDFGGTVGHVAANSRGDVFVDVASSSGSYLEELTAASGLQTQVALITGMANPSGGHSAFVDSSGNVYATDTADAQIVYVPFVNGSYPTGAVYSALTNCSAFPVPATQTTTCKVPLNYTSAFGYYIQAADVALDGHGNLYLIDKYTGGTVSTQVNKIVEFPAASNVPVVLVDNLSNQGSAELAVDAAGDIWYEDGTGNNYYLAAGTSTPVSLSLYYVTGVSIDSKGTVYFTESNGTTGSQILGLPQVGSTACAGSGCLNNQYTITQQLSTAYSNYPSGGIGIDGSGRLYFAGSYPNSLSSLYVNAIPFSSTPVNTTSGALTYYLNFGNNNAYKTFSSFAVTGPFAVSSTTCAVGTSYGPYTTPSCTVAVTFAPTAAGAATGTLKAIDSTGATDVQATLSGTGTGGVSTTLSGASTTVYGSTPTYTATAGANGTYTVAITGTATSSASVTIAGGTGSFTLPALGVGTYTLSLTAGGTTATTSVSVTAAPLTVTAANAQRSFNAPNPAFSTSYSGFKFSDTASVVSGAPGVSTAATRDSAAGSYPIVPTAGTAAAANYTLSTFVNGTLTVAGGAAQTIYFPPLPNFTHGTSVVLTAVSTSGLPIAYSVAAGSASISGTTLTITGTGTVTVQAAQAGNSSYAAATAITRSFTAQ